MNRFSRACSVVLLGIFLALAGACTAKAQTLSQDQYFTLKDTGGNDVSLKSLLGANKAILINFWATWCPPCREEIPDLIRLQNQYKDRSFTVVGVDVSESARKVSKFAEKFKMNYPILLDDGNKVSDRYNIVGIPTSLLVSSDGTILGEYHAAGPDLFAAVEKAIR